jgi:hypothetical protein
MDTMTGKRRRTVTKKLYKVLPGSTPLHSRSNRVRHFGAWFSWESSADFCGRSKLPGMAQRSEQEVCA